MRSFALFAVVALAATAASAQLPGLSKRGPNYNPQAPALLPIDALRADFLAKSGGDTIFFGLNTAILGTPAKASLNAQAMWIRQHPDVVVRVEGHGDSGDTRDHALAIGARRAEEVRDYLVLMGVPAAQVSTTSLGKERPGTPRAQTLLVR